MARGRRAKAPAEKSQSKAAKLKSKSKSKSLSPLSSRSPTPQPAPEIHIRSEEDKCPQCAEDSKPRVGKEKWIRCDACSTWYHWLCTTNNPTNDVESIDKWFCQPCMSLDKSRLITVKRKSARKVAHLDYSLVEKGIQSDPERFLKIMDGKKIKNDGFKRMDGKDVGIEWLEAHDDAMTEPIVIEKPEALGMKMPPEGFTVENVAELVGEEVPVEVIDVGSQSTAPGWNLGKWADYIELEPHAREKVYNVISLEVTGTPLADLILPPRLVRELDWVENFWPGTRKGKGHVFPKVQLYCLMGVAKAWTDWHIDFAGSSVYYHIHSGSKVFYFIRPTPANLDAYERWSGSELQNHVWLGDMVDEVTRVELVKGNTMIIPTGWIHAVYTPMDTLVFGGNFVHTYNVPTQLKVRSIEIATQVPRKFRYPQFTKLCWYVGDKYLRDIKAKEEFSPKVLQGIEALAEFLVSEARVMESGSDAAKKESKEQVPLDRVKDPAAMARELRWRARLVNGQSSDDEGAPKQTNGHTVPAPSNKRKRAASVSHSVAEAGPTNPNFRNFKPRKWETVEEKTETSEISAKRRKPNDSNADWASDWAEWDDEADEAGSSAKVERRVTVVCKVRQTSKGLERQRIQRTLEEWVWIDEEKSEDVKMDVDATSAEPPAVSEPAISEPAIPITEPENLESQFLEPVLAEPVVELEQAVVPSVQLATLLPPENTELSDAIIDKNVTAGAAAETTADNVNVEPEEADKMDVTVTVS